MSAARRAGVLGSNTTTPTRRPGSRPQQSNQMGTRSSQAVTVTPVTAVATRSRTGTKDSDGEDDDDQSSSSEDDSNKKKMLVMRTKKPAYAKMMNLTRHHWIRYFSLETMNDTSDNRSDVLDGILLKAYGPSAQSKRNAGFRSTAQDRMRKWSRDWQRAIIRDFKIHVHEQLQTIPTLSAAGSDNRDEFLKIICGRVNIPTLRSVFKPCAQYVDWNTCFMREDLRTYWVSIYGYFCWHAYEFLSTHTYSPPTNDDLDPTDDNDEEDPSAEDLSIFEKFRLTAKAPAFAHIRKEDIPFISEVGTRASKPKVSAEKRSMQESFLGQIRLVDRTAAALAHITGAPSQLQITDGDTSKRRTDNESGQKTDSNPNARRSKGDEYDDDGENDNISPEQFDSTAESGGDEAGDGARGKRGRRSTDSESEDGAIE